MTEGCRRTAESDARAMTVHVKSPRWRWSFIDELRRATPTIRLLVLTQLTFNVGFFMVLPYLSVHLTSDLGLGAALVGVVLGIRTFSQQGLFFVGGTLADRWGVKPVVLIGCVLRVFGFVGLAVFGSLTGVLLATVLVGFAAALFSPAVESAVAIEAGKSEKDGGARRVETFALLTVAIRSARSPALSSGPCCCWPTFVSSASSRRGFLFSSLLPTSDGSPTTPVSIAVSRGWPGGPMSYLTGCSCCSRSQ